MSTLSWLTAGRGIAHSERTPPELRFIGTKLGIQSWVALSAKDEEAEPDFVHYDADDLPVLEEARKVVLVIAGSLLGASSPVKTSSSMFYADISLAAGASLPLDPSYDERTIYTVAGEVEIAGDVFGPAQLLVFRPGDRITIRANQRRPPRPTIVRPRQEPLPWSIPTATSRRARSFPFSTHYPTGIGSYCITRAIPALRCGMSACWPGATRTASCGRKSLPGFAMLVNR